MIVWFVFSTTVHPVAEMGLHPAVPAGHVQVTLVAPEPGVAVRFTVPSSGKAALHDVPGQVIPGGALVTVPLPATTTVKTDSVQTDVPIPAVVTNAEPKRTLCPSFMVAVTFPLPQSFTAVTSPGVLPLNWTRF